jgi:hypothetical protein
MPQSLLTGQLKEKPIYSVWCLGVFVVHSSMPWRYLGDLSFQTCHQGGKFLGWGGIPQLLYEFTWFILPKAATGH